MPWKELFEASIVAFIFGFALGARWFVREGRGGPESDSLHFNARFLARAFRDANPEQRTLRLQDINRRMIRAHAHLIAANGRGALSALRKDQLMAIMLTSWEALYDKIEQAPTIREVRDPLAQIASALAEADRLRARGAIARATAHAEPRHPHELARPGLADRAG